MEKIKVALVCPDMLPIPAVKGGAIETLVEHIVNENEQKKEIDLYVYSVENIEARNISKKYKNIEFVYTKYNKKIFRINNKWSSRFYRKLNLDLPIYYFDKIIKDINNKNIDKIVIQANHRCTEYFIRKFPQKDIYLHIHSDDFCNYSDWNEQINRKCKKVILVSEFLRNQAKRAGYTVDNMVVLKNCINNKLFDIDIDRNEIINLKSRFGIKDDEKVILFTGRILQVKGVKELILAFKELLKDNIKVKLIIVGNAGFGESIKTKYDEELIEISKDISDKIVFTGFISNKELPKIHAICDISVVPSIWEEAAGLVVIESMQSGLPLVVTDSGGIHEYVDKNYVLEVKRDENLIYELYKNMKKLLEDDELRKNNAQKSKDFVKQFNTENFYKNFLNIINQE